MTKPTEALAKPADASERMIIALDVETADAGRTVIDELRDEVGAFKIGLQLFTTAGPKFVRDLTDSGVRVFLDLKFHDIPNTVAKAAIEAARLGVWMFNVHAIGGGEMMRRAASETRELCERENLSPPIVIGVTVLTSSDNETLSKTGVDPSVEAQVRRLAQLAAESGLDGVVASAHEVQIVKATVKRPDFITVTPGIRPADATSDDQKRVTTVREAFANGSDYVVIGRPVVQAIDRVAAVRQMLVECE